MSTAPTQLNVLGYGLIWPDGRQVELPIPEPMGGGRVRVMQVDLQAHQGELDPDATRRLGRPQVLALLAAQQAVAQLREPLDSDTTGVFVGTGLGNLGDTLAFLENLVRRNEQLPIPAKFINSVHNSIASQIAIALKLRGENHTFTHAAASFEQAFEKAAMALSAGRVAKALVVGVDALNAHFVALGREMGWWRADDPPLTPRGSWGEGHGAVPGEGAAAFLVALPGRAEASSARGRVISCASARGEPRRDRESAVADQVQTFLDATIDRLAVSDPGTALLLAANGNAADHERYRTLIDCLNTPLGRPAGIGWFKHRTGDFCTSTPVGLAAIMAVLDGVVPPERLALEAPRESLSAGCLFRLGEDGSRSAWRVSR